MQINLTIQEYAHLRVIVELKGDCSEGRLSCDRCPLQIGVDNTLTGYIQKECAPKELREKIALGILMMDTDIKDAIVIEKL